MNASGRFDDVYETTTFGRLPIGASFRGLTEDGAPSTLYRKTSLDGASDLRGRTSSFRSGDWIVRSSAMERRATADR